MFFKGVPLFSGLNEADHNLLVQVAVRRNYPRHALIVQDGDPGERFYLLRKGRAKVYLGSHDGREVILSILGPGDFFGEMALIDNEPCSASVMTQEESEFVSIGKDEFRRVLASSPSMAANLLKVVFQRLREADRQIEALALKDVQARVTQVLRQIAEPEGGNLVVPARLTHRDIAAMVGASREMVTRVFRILEENGVLRVVGRHVTIIPFDPAQA
jgi:CRP/FNR family transcriptional regulator, cyclic AMP receptor protein